MGSLNLKLPGIKRGGLYLTALIYIFLPMEPWQYLLPSAVMQAFTPVLPKTLPAEPAMTRGWLFKVGSLKLITIVKYLTLNKLNKCFISVPPMIPPAQTELSVIQGFQALLPCAAQGSPEPRISWEKDGTTVPNLPGKFTVLRSGELIIERAEVQFIFFTALRVHLSSGLSKTTSPVFFTVRRCWSVHMCGHQCSRLSETRHPPVHQHEACLQGAAS